MLLTIEGIAKHERPDFKKGIESIKGYKVIFKGTDALVSYYGDYIVTEDSLIAKSMAKKEMIQFVHDFRLMQFKA